MVASLELGLGSRLGSKVLWAVFWGVLTTLAFLVFPLQSLARELPKNDAEIRVLFDEFKRDLESNRYLKNEGFNLFRDGKPSRYLRATDPFLDHALPVAPEVVAKLPDSEWFSYDVFRQALRGMRQILRNFPNAGIRRDVLTVVDFGQKTEHRRLAVLDLNAGRVLFQTWVHHGRRSDEDLDRLAETFSNVVNSNTSSPGFMITSDRPYYGTWGYSLRTHGIDGNLNSNVHKRAMVIHPWPTIHPKDMAELDPIVQTSLGCLSLPYYESGRFYGMEDEPLSKLIIDTIRGRSVIYVSTTQVDLERESLYLRSTALLPSAERSRILARVNDEASRKDVAEGEFPALPAKYQGWRP